MFEVKIDSLLSLFTPLASFLAIKVINLAPHSIFHSFLFGFLKNSDSLVVR
jgi:hypothetical protein